MCGYAKDKSDCKGIKLTAQEKKMLLDQGQEPQDEYFYCAPCLRLLNDPKQGPQFMRGLFEQQLRQSGVPGGQATKLADKYYSKLIELQRKAKHGTSS
jgi:hypothetical protein